MSKKLVWCQERTDLPRQTNADIASATNRWYYVPEAIVEDIQRGKSFMYTPHIAAVIYRKWLRNYERQRYYGEVAGLHIIVHDDIEVVKEILETEVRSVEDAKRNRKDEEDLGQKGLEGGDMGELRAGRGTEGDGDAAAVRCSDGGQVSGEGVSTVGDELRPRATPDAPEDVSSEIYFTCEQCGASDNYADAETEQMWEHEFGMVCMRCAVKMVQSRRRDDSFAEDAAPKGLTTDVLFGGLPKPRDDHGYVDSLVVGLGGMGSIVAVLDRYADVLEAWADSKGLGSTIASIRKARGE